MNSLYVSYIASQLSVREWQIENCVQLLEDGATVPFISRYRKERTGSMDEVTVAEVRHWFLKFSELEKRKQAILKSIEEQGKLTEELAAKFAPRIRVNAVAPGAVLQEDGQSVAALERLSNFNPLKAHGSAEGLAECVRFLLATDFITGQTICYDGGYRLRFRKNNS